MFPNTPLTTGVGSKDHFFRSESRHSSCQINGKEAENTVQALFYPSIHPRPPERANRSCCIKGNEVKSIRQV